MPRILCVEDNPENRTLIRRILIAEGYAVAEASNAFEGLQIALVQAPDLILLDVNMPHVDGLTLASRLKSYPSLTHVPVVAITANVMRGDRERSLAAGCDGYIQKPIDVDMLPAQVARFLHPLPVPMVEAGR
ncbi:MAG TPA: response regulator, partial [Anaerolineales bacterium]|nr:response regulator [Anaerolineales bacterium]